MERVEREIGGLGYGFREREKGALERERERGSGFRERERAK